MRNYLLILSFVIIPAVAFIQPGFSQTQPKETFDSAVDYLNYKIISYRLSGNSTKLTDSLDRLDSEGRGITYDQLKVILGESKGIPDDVFPLFNEINQLKVVPQGNKKAAVDLLTKGIYEDSGNPAIVGFYTKRKVRPDFIDYKREMDDEIAKRLSLMTEGTANAVVTDPSPGPVKKNANLKAVGQPKPESKPNSWKDKIYYMLAFIVGGVVTFCFQLLFEGRRSGRLKDRSSYNTSELEELKNKNATLKASNDHLLMENKSLREKFKLKAAANQNAGNQPVAQPSADPTTQPPKQPLKQSFQQLALPIDNESREFIKEEKSPTIELAVKNTIPKEAAAGKEATENPIVGRPVNVLYFPNPNRSGDFKNAGGKPTFIEGTSIYKFSLISPTEARFEFCEEKSAVATAINNRNDLILSVAEESNAYTPNATKILIADNQKGKAVLEGLSWRITDKAKIKYI